ncbi:MAG TPA: SDR family oxidoreductase [Gemmataceae bacterium]|jgi:glucose 1-dehydrogenase|nr:SDR family oxidoreductase [Gemmataceae bacterium]
MILAGKVALVTGASAGIGRAAALALAQQGADVAINYLTLPEAAEELAEQIRELGRRALLLRVDVSDQPAVETMVERTVAELGRLDVLVSSAVYSDREPFVTANMEGFRRTIDVTMWGAFYVLRASARHMIRQGQGGSVVLVSSAQAKVAHPSCMAYNMAKAAIDQMGRTAALELAPHRIRVNIIYPGWTDTPGERKFFSEEVLRQRSAALPCGRLAKPEEIARGIIFLVDPASEYITGSTLCIDGGSQLPWWSRRGTGDF